MFGAGVGFDFGLVSKFGQSLLWFENSFWEFGFALAFVVVFVSVVFLQSDDRKAHVSQFFSFCACIAAFKE